MQEALYRKYRPDSLKKLVGQPDAVALIEKQVKNNNLSHAYLFSGPRGVGKTSLARIIATTLGCDPVFDITEIDAASHNKVDDIRELNDSINFIASSPGKKRVFILDEVHMLSNAASNAFLKTLEEPPEHVIFILATTEPERVLETIKSRTTHLAFKRIGNDEIISTLNEIGKNEKIKINDDVLSYIANQSDGSLRDAINLFEQTHNTFGNKATIDDLYSILGKVSIADLQQIIESINTQDTSEILNILKVNYSKGLQPLDILNSITELFRNIFYFKYLPDDDTFLAISESENTLVKHSNELITAKQLSRVLDLLDELNQTIVNAPSQELKLELFLIKLIKPQLASDIKSISRRVDLLEGEQNIQEDVVKEIEKGLYLSNIHYLNWSDNAGGRITGLTRYACFWVEGGEIVAPIETMRFDDSFYRFFGDKLLHVEDKLTVLPEVGTYGQRSLGATKCPGILVDSFELTL